MYFKDLLRHRQSWLGIALLGVIFFHLPVDLGPVNFLRSVGYGGVDICFFASGIGCYYSLTSDCDIGNFMKRRIKRLMPTYFIFIIVWLVAEYIVGHFGIQMAIGNLLVLQHFTGHDNAFNWYISAALLFYLFAPYFKIIIDRSSPLCKQLFPLFLFVCSIPFWKSDDYIVVVARLPIFYIGMLFSSVCQQSKRISKRHILGSAFAFIAGTLSLVIFFKWFPEQLWSHGLYWYPFILITPPLCMAISYLIIRIESLKCAKPIISFFSLCGNYSFELYLIHILLISVIRYFTRNLGITNYVGLIWTAGIIPLVIGCYLLRRTASLFYQLCRRILHT